ncbi:MAG: hypothetical protein KAS98_09610 [Deltaproteobacteria bacterium]|jgi:hypothetical protein|nr:hypothetical protein [Deltaproteobacteria bacterium]
MKLFRKKEWTVLDIGLLKWSAIFFGMILGAFFPGFVKNNIWFFISLVVILAIKPVLSFWRK